MYLEAIFGGYGLPSLSVYVTDEASYAVSNRDVASVLGSLVVGHSPGRTNVSVVQFGSMLSGTLTTSLTVGGSVELYSLEIIAFSSVSGVGVLGTVGPYELVNPSFAVDQRLSAEGQVAYVVAYARYSDGTYGDVTPSISLSSNTSSLIVVQSSSGPAVEVAMGAESVAGSFLNGEWPICVSSIVGQ